MWADNKMLFQAESPGNTAQHVNAQGTGATVNDVAGVLYLVYPRGTEQSPGIPGVHTASCCFQ